jgi:acyl dehydratase
MPRKYEHGVDYREGIPFEEFEIGDEFETESRTITPAELASYVQLAPNHSEGHLSVDATDGNRVVHGMVTLCVSQGLALYNGVPHIRPSGGLYGMENVRWTQPVYVGDTLHMEETIADKEDYSDEIGKLTYERQVKNQDDELVLIYNWIELAAKSNHLD